MIELFPADQSDFSKIGIALHPSACTVYQDAGGRYDANVTIPYNENGEHLLPQQDMILRIPVPPHTIGPINLGTVSYYVTTASTPMYKRLGYSEKVSYDSWVPFRSYTAGDMVTYGGQNYRCTTSHGGLYTPPPESTQWATASNYRNVGPVSAGTLAANTQLQKLADVNKDYALFATTSGANGYVLLSKVQATGQSTTRTVPQRNITVQLFRIDQVTLSLANRTVQLHAMHISYDMERKPLSSCVLYDATPQTALAFLQGAMLADDSRLLATDIDDTTITVDWSWINSLNAIMAPNDGLIAITHGKLIRDDNDIFILSNGTADPVYSIRYGANMRGVNWKRDTGKVYTRIYPKGKDAKGNDLFLPEGYIATSGPEPVIRTQVLQVDAQVGQQIEKPDGTVVKLTESDVITLLREAAQDRFTKDLCDQPVVTLDVEFLFLGDTAEYAQYKSLEHLHLYDYVRVTDTPDNLDQVAQVTGYRWDALRLRYERITVGNPHDYGSAGVSGYQIGTGSVSLRSLSSDVISKLQGASTSSGSNYDNLQNQILEITRDTAGNAEAIALKVSKGGVATQLSIECGNVNVSGGNLNVDGYVKADELASEIGDIATLTVQDLNAGQIDCSGVEAGSLLATTDITSAGTLNVSGTSTLGDVDAGDIAADSLTLDGYSIAADGLVASIGPATTDPNTGGVSIAWTLADGSNGTPVTFNIADTVYFQQAVSASWTNGYSAGVADAAPDGVSITTNATTPTQTGNRWYSTVTVETIKGGETMDTFPSKDVDVTAPYNAGVTAGQNSVTINKGGWSNGSISFTKSAGTASTKTVSLSGTVGNYDSTAKTYTVSIYDDDIRYTGLAVTVNASDAFDAGFARYWNCGWRQWGYTNNGGATWNSYYNGAMFRCYDIS